MTTIKYHGKPHDPRTPKPFVRETRSGTTIWWCTTPVQHSVKRARRSGWIFRTHHREPHQTAVRRVPEPFRDPDWHGRWWRQPRQQQQQRRRSTSVPQNVHTTDSGRVTTRNRRHRKSASANGGTTTAATPLEDSFCKRTAYRVTELQFFQNEIIANCQNFVLVRR